MLYCRSVLLLLFLFPLLVSAQGVWTQKPSIGNSDWVERNGAVGFSIGTDGYVVGGRTVGRQNDMSSVPDAYKYSGSIWSRITNCAIAGRVNGNAFTINGKGYVGMGYIQSNSSTAVLLTDLWEYNPSTNVWTQKASQSSGRYRSFCFVIGNYAYVGGGYNSSFAYRSDCSRYNPASNTWSSVASMPSAEARGGAASFSIGSKGFVTCGNKSANPTEQKDLWQYDTLTNVWQAKASMPATANACASGFAINGKGYVAGGVNATITIFNTCFEYDTTANSWTFKTSKA